MDQGKMEKWKSLEIFQNSEYANIYGKHRKYLVTNILGNTCFLMNKPLIGIIKAKIYFYNGDGNELLAACYRLSKEKKIPFIEIHTSTCDEAFSNSPCKKSGTYVIDLLEDIETIWKNLNKKARNQIRQAQKNNVTVSIAESETDFLEWWDIYTKTVDRKKFISDTFYLNKELFEHNQLSRLFVAKIDNKIISGNLMLLSDNGIIWKLGGANPDYFEYRPNHLLQWEIIEWAKKKGYSYYDMGGALAPIFDLNGVPVDEGRGEGPSAFKRKFGGEFKESYDYQIITNKLKYKIVSAIINIRFKLIKHQ